MDPFSYVILDKDKNVNSVAICLYLGFRNIPVLTITVIFKATIIDIVLI